MPGPTCRAASGVSRNFVKGYELDAAHGQVHQSAAALPPPRWAGNYDGRGRPVAALRRRAPLTSDATFPESSYESTGYEPVARRNRLVHGRPPGIDIRLFTTLGHNSEVGTYTRRTCVHQQLPEVEPDVL